MNFIITNPRSPGTKFNEYTDNIILACYKILNSKTAEHGAYKDLRIELEAAGVSKNTYLRNIFSFLKFCGFVFYERGIDIYYKNFFTKLGYMYIETIKTEHLIISDNEMEEMKKKNALMEVEKMKSILILEGIKNILSSSDCTYVNVFRNIINFLLEFNSIDENEFALLLFKQQHNELDKVELLRDIIIQYRNNEIELNFISEKTKEIESETDNSRKIPSFAYFLDILSSARIAYKDEECGKRYYLNQSTLKNTLETLGGLL